MASSTRTAGRPLTVIADLCAELENAGIEYCHFKSTDALQRSATGENDLDLLIAEDDVARFRRVLRALGYVESIGARSQDVPHVRHLYGLDREALRLVDVHAHERLIIGDDATKNYRLPIESAYLATAHREGLFPVPERELEFALFVVRMMLKHGSPEAIATGRGRLSAKEREERTYLADGTVAEERWRTVERAAPMLDRELLNACLSSLEGDVSVASRLETWRRLHRRLAPFARRKRASDIWLQLERRIIGRSRRLLGRRPTKRPASGGRVIALVGSDGSGKSTVANGLSELLSPAVSTVRMHLGKPPRSFSWRAVRGWLHIARRLGLRSATVATPIGTTRASSATPSRTRLLIGALTARDRRRAAERARRLASRGAIVICDRYPLPELAVDGPRGVDRPGDRVAGSLLEVERRAHERIPPPDLVVVLRVPADVARARRPEADPDVLEARAREILDARWGAGVRIVDASGPRDHVLRAVASTVWETL